MIGNTLYFDRAGAQNTDQAIQAAVRRAQKLGIQHIVVASTTGATALKVCAALPGGDASVICVGEHTGYWGKDTQKLTDETRRELEARGAKVLICSHALSGVGRSITNKFHGVSHTEIIAHTLRQFGGEGIKVTVEVAIMAADAGLIPTDREVMALGGTGGGADTAVVLVAAHMNNYFDLEVREIVAKPRQRKGA